MKRVSMILGVVMLTALAACGNTAPKTDKVAVFEGQTGVVLTLKAANAYIALPRCSATVHSPCSKQDVAELIMKQSEEAVDATTKAENIARSSGSSADVAKAKAYADVAVDLLSDTTARANKDAGIKTAP